MLLIQAKTKSYIYIFLAPLSLKQLDLNLFSNFHLLCVFACFVICKSLFDWINVNDDFDGINVIDGDDDVHFYST